MTASVMLALALPAAAQPAGVHGHFVVASDKQTVIAQAGGDTMIAEVMTLQYTSGGLRGHAIDSDTFIVHADGSFNGRGWEVCQACTVGGSAPGDFLASFTFQGAGDQYTGRLD